MSSRLAVDIGGTFTDVVLETGTTAHAIKVLTTPDAPERAVLEGVRSILAEAKCRPQRCEPGRARHDAGHQRADRAQGRDAPR